MLDWGDALQDRTVRKFFVSFFEVTLNMWKNIWTRKRRQKMTNMVMEKIARGGSSPSSLFLTVLKKSKQSCWISKEMMTQLMAQPWMFLLILERL